MSEAPERESVSLEDLVYSNMVQIEAITQLLVEKGVISPRLACERLRWKTKIPLEEGQSGTYRSFITDKCH